MGVDRTLSLLIKFAALDRLTGPMRAIGGASKRAGNEIAETRREIVRLQQAQAKLGAFKDMEANLRKESAALDAQRTKLAQLRAAKDQADGSTKKLTRSITAAEREEARLSTRYEQSGRELQLMSRRLGEAGMDVADLARHEDRLGLQLYETNKRLATQRAELERVARARARAERAQAIGSRMQSAGVKAGAAGVVISLPMLDATRDAREFRSAMIDIQQKVDLSAAATERMSRSILKMGPVVAQMPQDLQKGADTLMGLGLDANVARGLLTPIGKVSTAWKADVNEMSMAAYANFNNLKVPIDETMRAFDAMATAGKAGGFELKDMSQYFPMLTGRLMALGQKGVPAVADLSAALQVAFQDTGEAEQAATNIKNLLIAMNSPRAEEAFKKFGVDLPKALKQAYAEGKTPLEAIAALVKKLTHGDLSQVGHLFTNQEASAAVLSLIQHEEQYKKIRDAANKSGGINEAAFELRMTGDPEAKLTRFKAQMERLKITLGDRLLPVLNDLFEKAGNLADRFQAWADKNPGMADGLVKFAAGAAALLVVFGALGIVGGALVSGWGVFAAVLGGLWTVISFGFGIIGSLLGAIATLVGLPFLAVAAIAAALVVAGVLIYRYWDKIKAAFSTGWNWLKSVGMAGINWFLGLNVQMAQIGINLVQGIINGISSMFGALKAKIVSLGKGAVSWFKGVLGIQSPSRVFMGLGNYLTQGLALGVDRGADEPIARMKRLAGQMTAAIAMGTAGTAAAAASGPPPRAATAVAGPMTVQISIYQLPGQSSEDLARLVAEEFERIERDRRAARASSYEDDA
ncbi:MAG: phage tail tape measure protein [Pseudomonadota bacterium]